VATLGVSLLTALAPAVTAVRLSLHVLAACIWVGGQIVLAGLVPTVRGFGPEAPRRLARAFGRIQWPAYAVLLATGVWNVFAAKASQPGSWEAVLGAKIDVAVAAGLAAWLHQRSRSRAAFAAWGAVAAATSLAALVLGVLLAG
jgi:putative copper export protein